MDPTERPNPTLRRPTEICGQDARKAEEEGNVVPGLGLWKGLHQGWSPWLLVPRQQDRPTGEDFGQQWYGCIAGGSGAAQ